MKDLEDLVIVKGVLTGLLLTFGRQPFLLETKFGTTSHLRPYTPGEAKDAIDGIFAEEKPKP